MKKFNYFALMCMVLSLAGCDKVKDALSTEFTVKGVSFEFTAESQTGTATMSAVVGKASASEVTVRAAATQTFTETHTAYLADLDAKIAEYADKIDKAKANSSLLTVTTTPAGVYTVENLTVTATGVTGSLVVPSYTMGAAFTLPATAQTFLEALVMKLVGSGSVTLTVTGKTDAPSGTVLKIKLESEVVFTASVL